MDFLILIPMLHQHSSLPSHRAVGFFRLLSDLTNGTKPSITARRQTLQQRQKQQACGQHELQPPDPLGSQLQLQVRLACHLLTCHTQRMFSDVLGFSLGEHVFFFFCIGDFSQLRISRGSLKITGGGWRGGLLFRVARGFLLHTAELHTATCSPTCSHYCSCCCC